VLPGGGEERQRRGQVVVEMPLIGPALLEAETLGALMPSRNPLAGPASSLNETRVLKPMRRFGRNVAAEAIAGAGTRVVTRSLPR
jgi:hypothetical protein